MTFLRGQRLERRSERGEPGQLGPAAPPVRRDVPGLPTRADLVRRADTGGRVAVTEKHIADSKTVFFLPTSLEEKATYDRGTPKYEMHLFGILPTGSKAHVVLKNIQVYFDVLVPEGSSPEEVKAKLTSEFNASDITCRKMTDVRGKPVIGYSPEDRFVPLEKNLKCGMCTVSLYGDVFGITSEEIEPFHMRICEACAGYVPEGTPLVKSTARYVSWGGRPAPDGGRSWKGTDNEKIEAGLDKLLHSRVTRTRRRDVFLVEGPDDPPYLLICNDGRTG